MPLMQSRAIQWRYRPTGSARCTLHRAILETPRSPLTYADVCWRMQTYADVCDRRVCRRRRRPQNHFNIWRGKPNYFSFVLIFLLSLVCRLFSTDLTTQMRNRTIRNIDVCTTYVPCVSQKQVVRTRTKLLVKEPETFWVPTHLTSIT